MDSAADSKFWDKMDARPRMTISELKKSDIPIHPGAYALYRNAERMHVGKAASLQSRIWNNHCGKGSVMTGSALRRNIAEHLGIAAPADIKSRRYIPTAQDVADVRAWLEQAEIA